MSSSNPIPAYTLNNDIPCLAPVPGYTIASLGLSKSRLPSFKVTTRSISPSNAQNELFTTSLSLEAPDEDAPDAPETFIEASDASTYHIEDLIKATRYDPSAANQMISRYRPSAIPSGFDWGSDASNTSDASDTDTLDESDGSDLDEDTDEFTARDANNSVNIEEYDGRGHPFIYYLTDRDLMISYGYKDGAHPLLHYDRHDNLVVENIPFSSPLNQLDDEQLEEELEEAASAGEAANAQNALRPTKIPAIAPLGVVPLAVAVSAIAPPGVRPVTTKVATSKRKVAAKPRQKPQKDVFRAARTWVSKSNKSEMRQLLAEWFGEGHTDAENANDLGTRLSVLQKAYIESLDNDEEDNKSNKVVGEESEVGDETGTNEKGFDLQPLQSSGEISENSKNAIDATTATATEITKVAEEVPVRSPSLQEAHIKLLSDGPENKDERNVEDENETFDQGIHQTNEKLFVNSIHANQDIDMIDYNVSTRQSASLIGKKRERGDIEDQDDSSNEERTTKKAKILELHENIKQLGQPIKKAKKRAPV